MQYKRCCFLSLKYKLKDNYINFVMENICK